MQLNLTTNRKSGNQIYIDRYPDECPICHRGIDPTFLFGFQNYEKGYVHLSFYCPMIDCNNHFIGYYEENHSNNFDYVRTLLGQLKQKNFSETITNISKDFVDIYYQASSAEQQGLDQICGVGYRKALEFLIKDYIISKDETLKEVVEKSLLGKCINDHIKDERIKSIAKRATWLGNDETHYIRKWVGKNISDLKVLIDLTVHWIETEALTEKMIALMPD